MPPLNAGRRVAVFFLATFRSTPTASTEGLDRIGRVASEKRVPGETHLLNALRSVWVLGVRPSACSEILPALPSRRHDGRKWPAHKASVTTILHRLYLGIADGMPIARVWTCRCSRRPPLRGGRFEYRHVHTRAIDMPSAMPNRRRRPQVACVQSVSDDYESSANPHAMAPVMGRGRRVEPLTGSAGILGPPRALISVPAVNLFLFYF